MYGKYTRVIQKHSLLSIKIGFFPQSYYMYARLDSKSNTYVTLICLPVRNSALQKFIWFNHSDDNNFRIYMSCYMYTTIMCYPRCIFVSLFCTQGFWLYSFIMYLGFPLSYNGHEYTKVFDLISWIISAVPYIAIPAAAMHSCGLFEGTCKEVSYWVIGGDILRSSIQARQAWLGGSVMG